MQDGSQKPKTAYALLPLFEEYKRAPTEDLRNRIVLQYMHIARIVAARFSGKGVDYDDLYQVASFALLKAVERFDPHMGVQFQSFATPSVVGEVKNYFRDKLHTMNLPRRGTALLRQIEQARAQLSQTLLRSPTFEELCRELDLPEADVGYAMALQGAMNPSSLDQQIEGGETALGAFWGADDEGYERFELQETMKAMLSNLDENARAVLTERYFNERSQREVAEMLGVSQMTISRVERRALAQVRDWMKN